MTAASRYDFGGCLRPFYESYGQYLYSNFSAEALML
jgi:hypothetical protein